MKYKISGTWKTRVPVKSVDASGVESVDHFVAEFRELNHNRMKEVERERRHRMRRQIDLRRQIERLDRRLDDAYAKGDDERIEATEARMAELKAELEQVEDKAANNDSELLDEVLVAVHQLELEDAAGNIMGREETRDMVLQNIHLMLPTVQAFSDGITKVAEKNFGKSGAK